MNALYTNDYQAFYKLLEDNNNELIRHLVNEIDDASVWFWTDKSNYTNFIGALVTLFNQNAESIADRWPDAEDDFTRRVVNLNPVAYSRDVSSVFAQSYTDKYNNGEYDDSTGNITLYDVYKTTIFGADPTPGQNSVSYESKKEKLVELSPLTPVIITPEQEKIPLLQAALDGYGFGNGAYIVPAIFLKYNADKIRNDYIEKGTVATLDVATIAASGGTALATKVHWVRRAWALMEVAGAIGDITVNVANTSPELKPAIDACNMAMSIIGVKNIGKGVVNFAGELPANVKTLLQENKSIRSLIAARYLDWKIALYSIDELTEVEQQLLAKQIQVWRMLDINTATINNINDFWTRIPAEYIDNIKKAFDGVPTTVKYAEKNMILYRHISVDGPEISFWFSRTIESPENAKKLLALPKKNTAEWVVKVKIKEGTPYIEGKVASQANDISGTFDKNAIGGGNQLYFLLEDLGNIEKMEKFINPLK
jgi:hypothetical protein